MHIDLLDKEYIPKSVYDMYINSGKLTIDKIHFLRPNELKSRKK